MLSLDEALQRLLEPIRPLDAPEQVDSSAARGRVLAEAIRSTLDVPPADNSSMDGYALRCADVAARRRDAAGQPAHPGRNSLRLPLQPGTAARIFTGAQIPAGADAVVMQEHCTPCDGGAVRIDAMPEPGQWIRRRGEDIASGAEILPAGTRLTPQALGLAASVGCARLRRRAPAARGACFPPATNS